jgi:hypothetical protein
MAFAFDVLYAREQDYRAQPLTARREALKHLVWPCSARLRHREGDVMLSRADQGLSQGKPIQSGFPTGEKGGAAPVNATPPSPNAAS